MGLFDKHAKKKWIIGIALLVILIVLLVPFRVYQIKDGGSVEYKAVLYSVTKVHRMSVVDPEKYDVGWIVEILGKEVYYEVELSE